MDFALWSEARPAAVAGLFYPRDPQALEREVSEHLEQSSEQPLAPGFPQAVIAPHAGYIYSGAVAAHAYDALRPARGIVRRVAILGPCHRVPVRGLALPAAKAFDSPLGRVPLDRAAIERLRDLPQVTVSAATHAQEHALEVQLPFLQQVLGEFSLVPLVVGEAEPEEVAQVIEALTSGPETLVVISSDLSHYHPYEVARRIDRATLEAILAFDTGISHHQACGATPIAGMLLTARRRGLEPRLLDYRNSGDTAGGRDQVVGYAAVAFRAVESRYREEHGAALLAIARASIAAALGRGSPPELAEEPWLKEWRSSFVTLVQDGKLRGCVGSLEPQRPLGEDVAANARAAAFHDHRFPPLSPEELDRAEIEVSLLSPPKRIAFEDHHDLLAQLRPGVDGVILECGERRATFLPQVWEALSQPEQFLAQLKRKAGLPAETRSERCRFLRYTVCKWREADRMR